MSTTKIQKYEKNTTKIPQKKCRCESNKMKYNEEKTTTRHATTGKPPENSNCAGAQWAENVENAFESEVRSNIKSGKEGRIVERGSKMHKGRVIEGVEARGRCKENEKRDEAEIDGDKRL